jgi:hypothetical protein
MLLLEDLPISFRFKFLVRLRVLGVDNLAEVVEGWVMGGG